MKLKNWLKNEGNDWLLSPKMSHHWRKELWTNGAKMFGKKVFEENVSEKVPFSTDMEQKKHHLRVFENVSPHPLPYLKFFFLKHWVKSNKVLVEVSILNFFLITEAIFSICPICPKMSPNSRNKSVKVIFCLFSIVFPD